ncbi:MAG: sugar ABC transporter ATP-binding protein [Actinomycetota bacterium]|nr:sugar ABC transporter ATP-binding protein [Actinomycetota bacterium]
MHRVVPPAPHVELRGISKQFGGVRALRSVSLQIRAGTVHALVGENGAGKSTLGKVISGVLAPDSGEMQLSGTPVAFRSPRHALEHGVATIAQELAIVPELTAAENVFLGAEPRRAGYVRRRDLSERYHALCEHVGFAVPAHQLAGRLRTADQQKLEILRAVARDAALIIMDEPSAALTREETLHLHEAICSLRARGCTVVLVSHFLREVLELADAITVLRDGAVVRTSLASEESESTLIEAMLGRSLDGTFPPKSPPGADAPVRLAVEWLSAPGVRDATFAVRAGEIVGLAGLVGAGRSELVHAIVGARRAHAGSVAIDGRRATRRSPRRMLREGVVMIPESRKEQGLLLERSVAENTALSTLASLSRLGLVRAGRERKVVTEVLAKVAVRPARPEAPAGALSGGNQQKLLFARALLCQPAVLIADEPTRGVDVGARRSIYDLVVELAGQGLGVLLVSSDVEEVLGLSHRVLVMRGGEIVRELDGMVATEHEVLEAAFTARGVS